MEKLTLKSKKNMTKVTAQKYRKADKKKKTKILNSFVDQTGYNRKYAIHILSNEGKTTYVSCRTKLKAAHGAGVKRVYKKTYDEAVLSALIIIWEACNKLCGKLLVPFIRANFKAIFTNPKLKKISRAVREKLFAISPASADRLLKKTKERERIKGTNGTRPAKGSIKSQIKIMTHFECKDYGPGLWQIDLVQHDGGNSSGEFCYTLTITEIAHCWTVHYPLRNKAFRWVFEALDNALTVLPLPVEILHSDNGSEFINNALLKWCKLKGITLTRSRNSRKNDNCFVEQKNYATVRKVIGYFRFSGEKGVAALNAVYAAYDNLVNYFFPCTKLISKTRIGSKVKKTYDKPQTPFERALSDPLLPQSYKDNLVKRKDALNLWDEIILAQKSIDMLPNLADPVSELIPKRNLKPLRFGSMV